MRGIHVANKFKETDTMPTEGQFVAVWIGFNEVWSDTYQWQDDSLLVYSTVRDNWEDESYVDNVKFLTTKQGVRFFIASL